MSSLMKNVQQVEPEPIASKMPSVEISTSTATAIAKDQPAPEPAPTPQIEEISISELKPVAEGDRHMGRDASVSDVVWKQLQQDSQAAESQAKEQDRTL